MLRLVAKYPRIRRNGSFTLVVSVDEPYLSHRQNQGELTYWGIVGSSPPNTVP